MYYYKVVKTVGSKYYSYNDTEYSIEYKLDEFVQPRLVGSKLFVFKYLEDAKNFACGRNIFLVECINPRRLILRSDNNSRFDVFWSCISSGSGLDYEMVAMSPVGTYVCDSVKLIRELPKDEILNIRKKLYGNEPN